MVLGDDIRDFLAQPVALAELDALLHVIHDDERAHGGRELVVLVGAAELVLNVVLRVGQLARIVIEGSHFAEKRVGAYGPGSGLDHVGHHDGVMIGARNGDHDLLHEGLLEADELHEPEARGVAEHGLEHGTQGEEENERQKRVDAHSREQHGHLIQGRAFKEGRAHEKEALAEDERNEVPHGVLTAHGRYHKPGGQHGREKMKEAERHAEMQVHRRKKREQKAHGHIAAGRENHGHKAAGSGHGKGDAEGAGQRGTLDERAQRVDAAGGQGREGHHDADEIEILVADGRSRTSARGQEKAQGNEKREDEEPEGALPVERHGRGLVQGLELNLLLAAHAVAAAHDELALLYLVVDGLDLIHDLARAPLRGLAVQGQRGRQGSGEKHIHGPARVVGKFLLTAGQGRNFRQEGLHVRKHGHIRTQNLLARVQIADDDAAPAHTGRANIAHEAFGHAFAQEGKQFVEHEFLGRGNAELRQNLAGELRADLARKEHARILAPVLRRRAVELAHEVD